MDGPSLQQIEIYRKMTPAQRWAQAQALYWQARRMREAFEQAQHPDWTAAQVTDHVKRIFLLATT